MYIFFGHHIWTSFKVDRSCGNYVTPTKCQRLPATDFRNIFLKKTSFLMTSLESYVTWAACTNRRHIFVWSCWCSGSKPITHLLLGGWLRGGAGVLLHAQLRQPKKLWATWERTSACGLSDDLVCCRKHEFFSTAVFLCRLRSPFVLLDMLMCLSLRFFSRFFLTIPSLLSFHSAPMMPWGA